MDFSFRFDAAKGVERSEIPSGEVSNQMSLFYAYHSPMVRIITEQTQKYVNVRLDLVLISDENRNQFLLSLCILAAGSMNSIKDNSAPEVELNLLLRMLVTACILYDWVSIDGIFKSSSTIPILEVVSLIKKSTASPSIYLLPIQIASRDFNNPNIPVAIKNAFLA
ncbi:Protein FAM49-like protein [Zancudomyces culisetae]|uniref:Protein FAM49-like protein n=1 Tax=Zancudomyces culisetae TaxID=1213189 RepID=A0A1R1PQ08_ZANCU|nr:Protein FAM49-like protein [Zancudomyces culisetae]|eukprot:OMH83076.1 Protein FAM49-like protein [Zancudomyces culisetae]